MLRTIQCRFSEDEMSIRPIHLVVFLSTVSLCGIGHVAASPVLYAWAGYSKDSGGRQTYVIDPVSATVTMVRGPGNGGSAGNRSRFGAGSFGGGSGSGIGGNSEFGGVSSADARNIVLGTTGTGVETEVLEGNIPRFASQDASTDGLVGGLGPLALFDPFAAGSQDGADQGAVVNGSSVVSGAGQDWTTDFTNPSDLSALLALKPVGDVLRSSQLATPAAVPEPTTLGLLGGALAVLGMRLRRRKL